MVEKVLFDLGNVLLRFDFGRAFREMAAEGARMVDLEGAGMDALRNAYETGSISNAELVEGVSGLTGYQGTQAHFERSWQEIFEENTPMIGFLRDLREREIPCFLLSNSNDLHVRHIWDRYEVLGHFNDIIFSHEAKAMKPGETIYEMAIERFDLEPVKTAYIDDLGPNIETGRRFGFRSVHYDPDNHAVAETELKALGLLPA